MPYHVFSVKRFTKLIFASLLATATLTPVIGQAALADTAATTPTASSQAVVSNPTLQPNVAPGGNFDLSKWNLQLPIGTPPNHANEIPSSQLVGPSGFQDAYFYTDPTDGAMTFMDTPTGVTTSGSLHPRSELREVTKGWSPIGLNISSATLEVVQVSQTNGAGKVCIGQIFGAAGPNGSSGGAMLELMYFNNGKIQALIQNSGTSSHPSVYWTVGSVPLGTKFTYSLSLTGNNIVVTINGVPNSLQLPAAFNGYTFYFKAGDYDQTASSGPVSTTPNSIVKFYSLNVLHDPTAHDQTPPITTDNAPSGWTNQDVLVNLTASDGDGTGVANTYYVVDNGQTQIGNTVSINTEGQHTLTYWSVDNAGNIETSKTTTVQIDKTPPTLTITLDKTQLWPPNNQLVPIQVTIDAGDQLSGIASVVLTSITSNESDSSLGDIQDADYNTADTQFSLRATRSGSGTGRVYSITYTATDYAGNETTKTVTVTVPHDMGKK